jgi:hypothetical protein
MGPRIVELKCPQCEKAYTNYPLPEEFRQPVQTQKFLTGCDFCETELGFELFSLEKKQAYF